jgi:hypothetical protein
MDPLHSLPNFYSIIPSYVRYDRELTNFAKVLYSEISALTNAKGYCFAYNRYFEKAFNCTDRTIQRALLILQNKEYIYVDIERDKDTNQVIMRKIYILLNDMRGIEKPIDINGDTPPNKNDYITRVNASNLKNNIKDNKSYNNRPFNSFKNKPKDVEIEWLDDYIKNFE